MLLDALDRKLLNTIQTDFPLTEQPYLDIGNCLGIGADEVIRRIEHLKSEHIIRMIGPVINARRLGFESTLVAAKVGKDRIEQAENIIAQHPGVSHGYERNHQFNLWFTLAIRRGSSIERDLANLNSSIGAETLISLPALKLFKIGAYFDMDGDMKPVHAPQSSGSMKSLRLSKIDKLVINELQQDLALNPTPFNNLAVQVGLPVETFLSRCQSLIERAAIRRFSASINHRQAGFGANAMACWATQNGSAEFVGQKLAELREVSHCYERKTNPSWRYNLFAMIHGHSEDTCQEIARQISEETGQHDFILLYSTKEFKKTRVKYLV